MEATLFGITVGSIPSLIFFLAIVLLDYIAVFRIITKAGFSPKWILVPLIPVGLWLITLLVLIIDVKTVIIGGTALREPVGFRDFPILIVIDSLGVLVTWIFFLIFAFSDWPVTSRQPTPIAPFGRPPFAPPGHAQPGVPTRLSANPFDPSIVRAAPTALPTFSPPTVIYCSWCGKQREMKAQAIHHCGPLDRPAVFCMDCGNPLGEGATECATCGTPATKVSKH
jgi:hypothetical protein